MSVWDARLRGYVAHLTKKRSDLSDNAPYVSRAKGANFASGSRSLSDIVFRIGRRFPTGWNSDESDGAPAGSRLRVSDVGGAHLCRYPDRLPAFFSM